MEEKVKEFLLVMRDAIIRRSQEAGQEATGATYRAITVDDNGIVAPAYFSALMYGRGPGSVPYDMPQIIMDWARAKGLGFSDARAFVRFANAVAWKIRREGTEQYRSHRVIDLLSEPSEVFTETFGRWLDSYINGRIDAVIAAL